MSASDLFGLTQKWQTAIYRKRYAFHTVCANQLAFRRDFMDWLSLNWHVWLAFEEEANRLWKRGCRHYSARTIGEFLRHQTAVREGPNEHGFKINNNFFPDLGRLYMLMTDRPGFFSKHVNPLSVRAA